MVAVAHTEFREGGWGLINGLLRDGGVVMDVRGYLDRAETPDNVTLWRF
ncbi:MAG: hypothetical protein R3C16_11020 [Hyphomonadaceae bacterium]